MKKLILSSLAVLGVSAAFVAPAEAQVLVNSTPPGGSITGAASFTNFNGSTSAIAGEVTYPSGIYATDVNVTLTPPTNLPSTGDVVLEVLDVSPMTALTIPAAPVPATVEEAVAADLDTLDPTANLNEYVSIVRAWTSGGLD